MTPEPLDELELFDLMQAAYPEKYSGDTDEAWDEVEQLFTRPWDPQDVEDLLARVVMLAPVLPSGISSKHYHVLGKVEVNAAGKGTFIAAVKREHKPT